MERTGINVIHFEIGDPDFNTPPNITHAACKALLAGETHYTDSKGVYELREVIVDYCERSRGFRPDISQVVVTTGANSLIYYTIQCLADPGDEVIYPDPSFPSYKSAINLCNAVGVPVPLREENGFSMRASDVEDLISEKTKLVIMNSPHNPTGAITEKNDIKEIAELCNSKGIYLYSDEIYYRMAYDKGNVWSPGNLDGCKTNTIIATGLSKPFAMTGWRVGFGIMPSKLVEKFGLLTETIVSCVPKFIQTAAIEALMNSESAIEEMVSVYKKRRDLLVNGINNIKGMTCLTPAGSFYAYANIKDLRISSREFSKKMLEQGHVGLLPGTDFGDTGEGYIRLVFAIAEDEIKEGVERIRQVVESIR